MLTTPPSLEHTMRSMDTWWANILPSPGWWKEPLIKGHLYQNTQLPWMLVRSHPTSSIYLGDNGTMSLKLLSLKLLMLLLALTRPSRSNDLFNLDPWFLKILPDDMQFQSKALSKQSRPSWPVTPFVLPSFPADKRLCPKEILIAYMNRTESSRGAGNDRKIKLFCLMSSHITL